MKRTLLAVLIALSATCANASVLVGVNDSGNCYPFSCFASDGGTVYQQVYDASAFTGPLDFDRISFFRDTSGEMDDASYTVGFSTTSKAVMGLDPDPANNLGGDYAVFGSFTVSGPMPDVLSFTGNTFHYDPTLGNLLMQVTVDSLTTAHRYESFFQADYTGAVTSRGFQNDSGGYDNEMGALVTRFDLQVVPEPATLGLLGLGLAGLGFARRRKA